MLNRDFGQVGPLLAEDFVYWYSAIWQLVQNVDAPAPLPIRKDAAAVSFATNAVNTGVNLEGNTITTLLSGNLALLFGNWLGPIPLELDTDVTPHVLTSNAAGGIVSMIVYKRRRRLVPNLGTT